MGRLAARGRLGLLAPAAAMRQVLGGNWRGGLGGPVGESVFLTDVALRTVKGERIVDLYETDLGDTTTFGVHSAAVCPKDPSQQVMESACENTYFAMLKSTQ